MRLFFCSYLLIFISCDPLFSEPTPKEEPIQKTQAPSEMGNKRKLKTIKKPVKEKPDYTTLVKTYEQERLALAKQSPSQKYAFFEAHLLQRFKTISEQWMGTRWDLGVPQATQPGPGKINCGTFVGRVLNDAGFKVDVKHLQRQPAQLIIESFVGKKRIRKFSKATMERFLDSVREMGPGLFIIGLDFHVGFLLQDAKGNIRFIHSSYETNLVRNEPASKAQPIITSKYRVVGKILSEKNIRDWVKGKKIKVKGKW